MPSAYDTPLSPIAQGGHTDCHEDNPGRSFRCCHCPPAPPGRPQTGTDCLASTPLRNTRTPTWSTLPGSRISGRVTCSNPAVVISGTVSPSRFSRSCHPLGHVARRELPVGPPPPHRPSPGSGFTSSRRGFHRTEARSIRLRPVMGVRRDTVSEETRITISASSPSWPNSQALPCSPCGGGVSGLSSLSYSRSGLFITGCPKGVDPPAWPVARLTAPDASQVTRGG